MNNFQEEMLKRSETVFQCDAYEDVNITEIDKDKLLALLCSEDEEFGNIVKSKPKVMFTYGDKFFAPSKNGYICIPKKITENKLLAFKALGKTNRAIVAEYNKLKGRFKGYFEIS